MCKYVALKPGTFTSAPAAMQREINEILVDSQTTPRSKRDQLNIFAELLSRKRPQ
jgi:hypothetical protein